MAELDIILATHNHLGLTISCLEALYAHTSIPFRLIVVDDSTDKTLHLPSITLEWLEWWASEHDNMKIIHSNTPYIHGNQIIQVGIEHSDTPIIAYLGNSTKVEPDWIDIAWEIINKEPSVGLIGFKLLYESGIIEHAGMYWTPDMPHHMNYGVNQAGHRYTFIREVDLVGWALFVAKKEALPQPLDTTTFLGFRGYDDVDNCLEMRKKGWRILYCGFGSAYHLAGATRHRGDEKYAEENEENRQRFLKKWGGTERALNSAVITRYYA